MREGISKHGFKLYRGIGLTLPHSFLPTCLYVFVYENLMHKSMQIVEKLGLPKQANLFLPFLYSGFSEALTLIIELPFDTVRTRIQVTLLSYRWILLSTNTLQSRRDLMISFREKAFGDSTARLKYTSHLKLSIQQFSSRPMSYSTILIQVGEHTLYLSML